MRKFVIGPQRNQVGQRFASPQESDLSVGSVLALTATLSAACLQSGIPWPLAIVLMLLLGAAIGLIQGYFIAFEKIPAFIVTLAGLSVIRGFALLITGGYSIPIEPTSPFVPRHPSSTNDFRCFS